MPLRTIAGAATKNQQWTEYRQGPTRTPNNEETLRVVANTVRPFTVPSVSLRAVRLIVRSADRTAMYSRNDLWRQALSWTLTQPRRLGCARNWGFSTSQWFLQWRPEERLWR